MSCLGQGHPARFRLGWLTHMQQEFVAEFLGTLVLIVFGNGVVACVLLQDSYGRNAGWMAITAGWCFAVMAGVVTALAVGSHAHLNPALTIGMAVATGDWHLAPVYIPAQFLGAGAGAVLVWLHYGAHWRVTDDALAKRACFCTTPAIRQPLNNALSELIGTFALVFIAAALGSAKLAPHGLTPGLGPLLVGLLVWGIGLSLGGATGYAINPARDLGPRLAHALLPIHGKTDSDWGYAGIPVLAPIMGATLAGLLIRMLHL